jgi:hypothetical protein
MDTRFLPSIRDAGFEAARRRFLLDLRRRLLANGATRSGGNGPAGERTVRAGTVESASWAHDVQPRVIYLTQRREWALRSGRGQGARSPLCQRDRFRTIQADCRDDVVNQMDTCPKENVRCCVRS